MKILWLNPFRPDSRPSKTSTNFHKDLAIPSKDRQISKYMSSFCEISFFFSVGIQNKIRMIVEKDDCFFSLSLHYDMFCFS